MPVGMDVPMELRRSKKRLQEWEWMCGGNCVASIGREGEWERLC